MIPIDFQVTCSNSRSNHSFEPSVLSTSYILIPCLLAKDRICFYKEDKLKFCAIGGIYVSETFLVIIFNDYAVVFYQIMTLCMQVQASLPPEQTEQSIEQSNTATPSNNEAQLESMREADSFFSQKSAAAAQTTPPHPQQQQQSNVPYTRQRPFQEIVSEVQGSCIFLQESTIDMECMLSRTLFPLITSILHVCLYSITIFSILQTHSLNHFFLDMFHKF